MPVDLRARFVQPVRPYVTSVGVREFEPLLLFIGNDLVLARNGQKPIPNKKASHPSMKYLFTPFHLIGAIALLALTVSCTETQRETQHREKLLIAAGFKVIVPHTAKQQQKLKALPPDRITLVRKDGKSYYVFADAANNQAYVGGPTQYHAYQQIQTAIQFRKESLEAAGFGEEADWGTWDGWGGPGWSGLR
jgi:hypothetical protein